jgi:hypothetical protein
MKIKLFILVLLLGCVSCQHQADKTTRDCCISSSDSLSIVKEIIEATDAYAEANNDIDASKCGEFYDSSPDFWFAETGSEYPNWDTLYLGIQNWYSQPLDTVKMIWEERNIRPLTRTAATLYSKFSFMARFKSGTVYKSSGSLTGLMTKKDGKWKMTQGYCAIKVLTK